MIPGKILRLVTYFVIALIMLGSSFSLFYLGSTSKSTSSMTLNRGLNGEPESLDPQKFRSTQAGDILRDLREGLVVFGQQGQLVGGVASHWTVTADGHEYVFYLRPDARWSNGEQITAEHFVFAFRRLVNPQTAATYPEYLSMVENSGAIVNRQMPPELLGVRASDMRTLNIELHTATPYFLQLLTHPSTFPLYSKNPNDTSGVYSQAELKVTNGAYDLDMWVPGSMISLNRNENYWNNSNSGFDNVIYHFLDESTEIRRYRAGDIDVTGNVVSGMFQVMKDERPAELEVSPFLAVYYFGFNLIQPPFSENLTLRRSLSMAIDRDALVKYITGRGEEPAYGWIPSGIDNYSPQKFDYFELSKEAREAESRRLYGDAGYGTENPLIFELRYNTSGEQRKIALAVQSMWTDVLGAEVILVNEEFKVLISNIQAMEVTQLFRLSWTADYNDAYAFLQLFQSNNPSNLTGYSSPTVDALFSQASIELDIDKRRVLLEEAERVALADHPVIPLYFYVSKHLVHPRIDGWKSNILDIHYSKHLSPARH